MSFSSYSYSQIQQAESPFVVYESPYGGETVNIGEWIYGSFVGQERPELDPLYTKCSGQVLNWLFSSGNITFNFNSKQLTMVEFLELNDTEIYDSFHTGQNIHTTMDGTFQDAGVDVTQESEYIWVLRFVDINGKTSGTIDVWFQIYLHTYH
ncbi:MAG: hypothetical protein JW779_04190 [Candidatus Thorarchaeota archaeon]|nr:hypothetical protein [Candidatus Thorarchaeota archaeon]